MSKRSFYRHKKIVSSIILLIVFGLSYLLEGDQIKNTISKSKERENTKKELVKVIKVVDGDTITIEGGKKVRYIGIDAPETKDPRKPIQCFGKEATLKNKELVEGKFIYLEKDISNLDKYGRLLRYVWLPLENSDSKVNKSKQNLLVNDYLVRQGFAYAVSFPPDIKHQDLFIEAQKEARANNRGLWANCPIDQSSSKCFISGCNNQLCTSEQNVASTCLFKEEYNCLQFSRCEIQPDGQCGWTQTQEYIKCLEELTSK